MSFANDSQIANCFLTTVLYRAVSGFVMHKIQDIIWLYLQLC